MKGPIVDRLVIGAIGGAENGIRDVLPHFVGDGIGYTHFGADGGLIRIVDAIGLVNGFGSRFDGGLDGLPGAGREEHGLVFGAAKDFVRSFVVRGLDGVEEVWSLGEKLFHPFPGYEGIVDLGEFLFDARFEKHDGIVLVLPIVVAWRERPATRSFEAVRSVTFAV